jgi:uncharacterized membrane protein YkvI
MKASTEEALKVQRALRVWRGTRKIAGVVVIVATVVMTVSAIRALKSGADTSQAMKMPFWWALVLAMLFVYSVKRIREIEATLRG